MKTPTTEVAEKQSTAVSLAGYDQYAGSGFENQTADDYALPFLHMLQGLSKKVQEDPKTFHQGMLINTVTGEVFEDGVVFVPALTEHKFVEWKPLSTGGGFVAVHEVNDPVVKETLAAAGDAYGALKMSNGNELVETFYVYGVQVQADGSPMAAVIAFTSTKIKKYKQWMTKARSIQIALPDGRRIPAPLFAHKYRLKTVTEKNTKGSFANWDTISFEGADAASSRLATDDMLFLAALDCMNAVQQGIAKPNHDSMADAAGLDDDLGGDASGRASTGNAKF